MIPVWGSAEETAVADVRKGFREKAVVEDAARAAAVPGRKTATNRKGPEMTIRNTQQTVHVPPAAGGPLRILLASGARQRLAPLATGLWMNTEAELHQTAGTAEAMTMLRQRPIELVVVDEELVDAPGIELVRLVARNHPFVYCALVSRLPEEQFHELTEGLGVLMQLSSPPQLSEAKAILAQLSAVDATGAASPRAGRIK